MHELDLKSLRLFVAVCETGVMRSAAAREHIEPSAISKRIAQLEASLGTALLNRDGRGIVPTAAGTALLDHARGLLASERRLRARMSSIGRTDTAEVRVAATASVIADALPEDIAAFLRRPAHRHIRIDLDELPSHDVLRAVTDGSAALGICWNRADLDGLDVHPYRHDELCLVVPAGHRLARRTAVSFVQTLDHAHVGLPSSTAVHTMLNRAAALHDRVIDYRAIVTTFDAELRIVAAGLGVSVTPRSIAQRFAQPYGLRLVTLRDGWARRQFALCCRRADALAPAALALLDFLRTRHG